MSSCRGVGGGRSGGVERTLMEDALGEDGDRGVKGLVGEALRNSWMRSCVDVGEAGLSSSANKVSIISQISGVDGSGRTEELLASVADLW